MAKDSMDSSAVTVGIDLGDKTSHATVIGADANWLESVTIPTTRAAFEGALRGYRGARVVLEVGTHSPWISRILERRGFEVIVANARRVRLIAAARRKTDAIDAEFLARLGRTDPALLAPVSHRGEQAQADLVLLRTRDGLVQTRTKLINMVRGHAKALGLRIPSCSAQAFHKRAAQSVGEESLPGITVTLTVIELLTTRIRELDRRIEAIARERYPETQLLCQITGVGTLTALCFVLTIEDPNRFSRSREVGAYLGLVPMQRDSGQRQPQLGITKHGDRMLRRLLVGSARYIIGPFGPDCDLRSFGLRLSASGGLAARNRATVAVARKLAVLMHRLWTTGEAYQPTGYRNLRGGVTADMRPADPQTTVGTDVLPVHSNSAA